jgi:hypothetical protein
MRSSNSSSSSSSGIRIGRLTGSVGDIDVEETDIELDEVENELVDDDDEDDGDGDDGDDDDECDGEDDEAATGDGDGRDDGSDDDSDSDHDSDGEHYYDGHDRDVADTVTSTAKAGGKRVCPVSPATVPAKRSKKNAAASNSPSQQRASRSTRSTYRIRNYKASTASKKKS